MAGKKKTFSFILWKTSVIAKAIPLPEHGEISEQTDRNWDYIAIFDIF